LSSITGDGLMRKQHFVEPGDLRPVGLLVARRTGMQRGDRGLHSIGLRRPGTRSALVHETQTFLDLHTFQSDGPALPAARCRRLWSRARPARIVQQHQGEQALDPGAIRHQPVEQPAEPDRFDREIGPHQIRARGRNIAFGEDEIDHGEHAVEPRRKRGVLGTS
jgi:hypothetical protein